MRTPFKRHILNVRPSANEESAALVNYFAQELGLWNFVAIYEDSVFGVNKRSALELALKWQRLSLVDSFALPARASQSQLNTALEQLRALEDVQVVILLTSLVDAEALLRSIPNEPVFTAVKWALTFGVGSEHLATTLAPQLAYLTVYLSSALPVPGDLSLE